MKTKKKILIFHSALAPYRVDFFNALDKEFDASFYFSLTNLSDQKFDQDAIQKKCTFINNYLPNGIDLFGYLIRTGIISIIKKENPDIILCAEYGPITLVVFFYKLFFNQKFHFYTMSDDSIKDSKARKGIRALLRNVIPKNIEGVIFPSEEVGNWYKENISAKAKTLELPIIHNDEVFRNELNESIKIANENITNYNLKGRKVILFVGRLVEVKNLPFLLKVIAQLKSNDWILVIVGDGILNNELRNQARILNISDKILFVGRKEAIELYAWYAFAQILVLPSTSEKFGAVVNEALLGGCKVLCSELAGASILINNDNGRVFSPYNEKEFLTSIEDTLKTVDVTTSGIQKVRDNRMPFTFREKVDVLMKNL
jgi:glycosyltransferase involved in cell wall biosynthesis